MVLYQESARSFRYIIPSHHEHTQSFLTCWCSRSMNHQESWHMFIKISYLQLHDYMYMYWHTSFGFLRQNKIFFRWWQSASEVFPKSTRQIILFLWINWLFVWQKQVTCRLPISHPLALLQAWYLLGKVYFMKLAARSFGTRFPEKELCEGSQSQLQAKSRKAFIQ